MGREGSDFLTVGMVLTHDLRARLAVEAKRRTLSQSGIMREALMQYLSRNEPRQEQKREEA
jgi:hypothetical protein